MTPDLSDTVVKVALGALISIATAVVLAVVNHALQLARANRERRMKLLDEVTDELGQGFGKFMLLVSAIGSYQTVEHRMQGESSNNAEIQRYAREFVATWADNERIVNKLALLNRPDALELLKEFRQMYNETLRISTQGSLLSESEVRALSSKVSSIQDRLLVALHDRPL